MCQRSREPDGVRRNPADGRFCGRLVVVPCVPTRDRLAPSGLDEAVAGNPAPSLGDPAPTSPKRKNPPVLQAEGVAVEAVVQAEVEAIQQVERNAMQQAAAEAKQEVDGETMQQAEGEAMQQVEDEDMQQAEGEAMQQVRREGLCSSRGKRPPPSAPAG